MDTYVKNFESLKNELDTVALELETTWKGAAADAFADAHQSWKKDADAVENELKRLRTAGKATVNNYRAAFRANAEMWPG